MDSRSFGHVRSHLLEWEDDPDIPGFRQKLLYLDKRSKAVIRLWFIPPDWGEDIFDGEPDRHYHKSVVERGYHLYGDFPHWEFTSVDDFDGDLYVFSRGIFMNRPPGSLHGLLPEPRSKAGAVILYWSTGGGTSIKEPDFSKETITVPFEKDVKVEINAFTPCTITQTEDMDWRSHPDTEGCKIKYLAEEGYGADTVNLVHIPTDWEPPGSGVFEVNAEALRPWLYIVNGDLSVIIDESVVKLTQDDFLIWPANSQLVLPDKPLTNAGCVALCSGHQLSAVKA